MWTLMRKYAIFRSTEDMTTGRGVVDVPVENSKARILIAEEEPIARLAARVLSSAGCEPETATTGVAALAALDQRGADVILCAVRFNGIDGIELLRQLRVRRPDIPVVMLTGDPSVSSAVAAMRQGAFDYVSKPLDDEELQAIVARALEMRSLRRENRKLRQQLDVASTAAGFVARSASSEQLIRMIRRIAPSRSTVLVEGESGTGKELVARMLHYWGARPEGPFVAVNCKAFAEGVVESELFGHEKGSFTGAIASRAGCFERASGGTLFLDEIAEAGTDFQAKLLRVLEDGEVLRVGASKPRKIDVRIVTATNRVLRTEVMQGRFRADLYFRLNVIPVRIAPLRARPDDVIPLANHFLAFHSAEAGHSITLAPEAERTLVNYPWPGNVRELENVIERGVVLSGDKVLTPEAFALDPMVSEDEPHGAAPPTAQITFTPAEPENASLQDCLDRAASAKIKAALEATRGNRADAATALGIDRTTLYRLIKRLNL
jgi:DNA-binding NtrC family response regulator